MKRSIILFGLVVFFLLTACREQTKEEVFLQGMEFVSNGIGYTNVSGNGVPVSGQSSPFILTGTHPSSFLEGPVCLPAIVLVPSNDAL